MRGQKRIWISRLSCFSLLMFDSTFRQQWYPTIITCTEVWPIWKDPNIQVEQYQGHEDDLEGGHWGGQKSWFEPFVIVLVNLVRQGNPGGMLQVWYRLSWHSKDSFVLILSKIFTCELYLLPGVDVWVQVAFTWLIVYWWHNFSNPLLNNFGFYFAVGEASLGDKNMCPMDYYRRDGGK